MGSVSANEQQICCACMHLDPQPGLLSKAHVQHESTPVVRSGAEVWLLVGLGTLATSLLASTAASAASPSHGLALRGCRLPRVAACRSACKALAWMASASSRGAGLAWTIWGASVHCQE